MTGRPLATGQRGVALIEVLIALLVVGIASIWLTHLLALGLNEGSGAKERALAADIAREKLDDLRQFSQLDAGAAGWFGYDEIGADRGGTENGDGSLRLPAGSAIESDTEYQRHWSATAFYFCALNAAAMNTACPALRQRPDFWQIAVTVSWTDARATSRSVMLESAIAAIEPGLSVNALIPAASGAQPIVNPAPAPAH